MTSFFKLSFWKSYGKAVTKRLFSSYKFLFFVSSLQIINLILFCHHSVVKELQIFSFIQGFIAFTTLIWLLPALFAPKRLRQIIMALEALFLALLFVYEFNLIVFCQTPITNSVLHQYLTPNPAEVREDLLWQNIKWQSWLLGGGIVFLSACFFNIVRLSRKFLSYIPQKILYVGTFSLCLCGVALWQLPNYANHATKGIPIYGKLTLFERFILGTRSAIKQNQQAVKQLAQLNQLPLGNVTVSSPKGRICNVVLIIGESLRRGDMHCYGYPLDNTPHLDSLIASGSLILYDDVVSCAPNTITSLPPILTFYQTKEKDKEWYHYPTLPMVFSAAGYYTFWSSNQERRGIYIQPLTAIASTCDSTFFSNARTSEYWWGKGNTYDEVLLPSLLDYTQKKRNVLQIVHLYGSHADFKDRYPKQYEKFSKNDILEPHLTEKQRQNTAEYMNSVYYNDFVVSRIIERYSHLSSIIIYFSDHALARYDNPEDIDQCSHENTESGLMIPFMVYMSDSFREENPEIYSRVVQAQNKPFMTDLLTHSMAELMGISSLYHTPSLEFWSADYDVNRPRIVDIWGAVTQFSPKHKEYRK